MPGATRAALEAAPGIARLEATGNAFAAVPTEGRWYGWGDSNLRGIMPQETREALEAAPG
eukprot:COSAG06_NODE_66653_length_254_cov_0.316129_1_plen_59_part_10